MEPVLVFRCDPLAAYLGLILRQRSRLGAGEDVEGSAGRVAEDAGFEAGVLYQNQAQFAEVITECASPGDRRACAS